MAERLAGGNVALALLGNTLPTGAILVVLIRCFGPISGAHFNPAVTLSLPAAARARRAPTRSPMSPRRSSGGDRRHLARARDVRPAGADAGRARRARASANGSARSSRPSGWSRRSSAACACAPTAVAPRGRALHHRRLLVHLLDLVRQPGGDHRARADRQLRRHPAGRRAGLHRRPAGRRDPRDRLCLAGCCGPTPEPVAAERRRRLATAREFG